MKRLNQRKIERHKRSFKNGSRAISSFLEKAASSLTVETVSPYGSYETLEEVQVSRVEATNALGMIARLEWFVRESREMIKSGITGYNCTESVNQYRDTLSSMKRDAVNLQMTVARRQNKESIRLLKKIHSANNLISASIVSTYIELTNKNRRTYQNQSIPTVHPKVIVRCVATN